MQGRAEIDLVSHSSNSADGQFFYLLNLTDIYSGWVETTAVLGKGQRGVLAALEELVERLPFGLCGIDSDNRDDFTLAPARTAGAAQVSTTICSATVRRTTSSSRGVARIRRMTMRMSNRRTGRMSASCSGGSATTVGRPCGPSMPCMPTSCGS